jgi:hypothetical protein
VGELGELLKGVFKSGLEAKGKKKWAMLGSNQRLPPCEGEGSLADFARAFTFKTGLATAPNFRKVTVASARLFAIPIFCPIVAHSKRFE